MSFRNEYILNVDVKRRMTSIVPTFKQGDSATLKFKIFDDGKEFNLTDFTRSEITFRLPSGQTIVGEPFLDANTKMIVYHFVGVEMSEVGKLETILSIYSGTSMVSIQPFSVWIFDHLKDKDLSYIGILQDLIAEVELLKVDVKNTLDEANQIKDDLDELLVETEVSETIRNTNELERIANENVRKSNETDRKTSEDTRKSNETTRIQNEQTRNANEQIRQQSLSDMNTIINQYKFTGTYKINVTYKKFNQVEFEGSSYIALVDNTNVPVSDTNTWRIFAQKGLKGDKGDTGAALSILGKLTNESQLPPTGHAGDAYTINGELYVWSEVTGEWENVGNIKGEKGDIGDSGKDGESAYEVAVHNGFVGTSEEWLASLKGAKGDPGKDADLTEINQQVDGIQSSLTTHTGNTEIHVTKAKQDKWDKVTSKADYIAIDKAVGGVYPDPNTLLDSVFITNHINAQSNGDVDKFWYIEQVFLHSADSVSYSRSQIARSYLGANADMKIRHFYNGTWSPWSPSIQSITTLPTPVNAALGTGWSVRPNYYLKYYKDAFGIVHLYGRVDRNGGGTLITTLPVGYRPVENVETGVTQGVTGHAYIEIFPDGRVNAPSGVADNTNILIECSFRTT